MSFIGLYFLQPTSYNLQAIQMALTKEKKKNVLETIKKAISKSQSLVFIGFKGMTVADATLIRRALRSHGVGFKVTKKSLAKIALEDNKYEGNQPELGNELAIAYSEDELAPSREIYTFTKKLEGKIKILGGVFSKKYQTGEFINELAMIPPLEVLRAKIAYLFNSPMQRLAIGLSEVAKKKN
jgi:large subunit ribosomal protein L10